MASVRLKIGMIIDGKLHPRGSVLDEALVPKNLRRPDYINQDPGDREGRVLVLRGMGFSSIPKPDSEGIPTSYPVHVPAGSLLDLATVPEAYRQSLKEGKERLPPLITGNEQGIRF